MFHLDPIAALQLLANKKRAGLAPSDSPVFTGSPTAPTPTTGDNDTSIATTAFVQEAVASGVGGSGPGAAGGYLISLDAIADPVNDNFAGVTGALDTGGTRFSGASAWTWHNQGSATADIVRGGATKGKLKLFTPSGTGGHHIIWVPAPTGSWIIRAHVGWPLVPTNSTKAAGMILMDSVGGKIEFWGWGISPTGLIWAAKYTNATTLSATRNTAAQTAVYLNPRFFEIEKDGTNYYLRYGNDEAGMTDFTSFAHTNFLDNIADRIGLTVYSDNAAGTAMRMDVEEFHRVI